MSKNIAIYWHRQDLRIQDNPALVYASQQQVVPVYIYDESMPDWHIGSAQKWWLHKSLENLSDSYKKLGINLIIRRGKAEEILHSIIKQTAAKTITWNRCYDPQSIKRDTKLKKIFLEMNLEVKTFNDSLLTEPSQIKTKTRPLRKLASGSQVIEAHASENRSVHKVHEDLSGEVTKQLAAEVEFPDRSTGFFKVFTPYWKECLRQINPRLPLAVPSLKKIHEHLMSDNLNSLNLLPTKPNWAAGFEEYWTPGENGAQIKMNQFLSDQINGYAENRDIPGMIGTSQISPHLHFGEISVVQIWHMFQNIIDQNGYTHDVEKYLAEIGWREFSYYLLYHFNELPKSEFNPKFTQFPWQNEERLLKLWQKGLTGYPIVDAGMRQLWHTGWMHNRVRMIVASFLTKHLMISWQKGADWFLDTLLDADIASNSASWQWVAGCGADASPYFRIFNPIIQGQKFDPNGSYVRKWVPEIAKLPNNLVHTPWLAEPIILRSAGVKLGENYPYPIVDHQQARSRALEAYNANFG